MPHRETTLILIGFEGPELRDPRSRRLFWRPTAADSQWRSLVKEAVIRFLLRNAQEEWRWDASTADVKAFRNATEFRNALGHAKYHRVVVYSHGDQWGLMPRLNTPSSHVRDYSLAKALAEAEVRETLLLGCRSKGLAETAARVAEGAIRIGGIEPSREDEADKQHLDILNAIIWGFGGTK